MNSATRHVLDAVAAAMGDVELPERTPSGSGASVLEEAMRLGDAGLARAAPAIESAQDVIASDGEVRALFDRGPDSRATSFVHAAGRGEIATTSVLQSLARASLARAYIFGLGTGEETLAQMMRDGFADLRRALRGEPVRQFDLVGLAGMRLADGDEIQTPWGTLRAVPDSSRRPHGGSNSSLLFVSTGSLTVKVLAAEETGFWLPLDISMHIDEQEHNLSLVRLACALGGSDESPATAVPIFASGFLSFLPPTEFKLFDQAARSITDLSRHRATVQEWARVINESHHDGIEIAGRRIVAAVSERSSATDSLIDAVTAWENLVGTDSETSFRTTAALAVLLDDSPAGRMELWRRLKGVYGVRSRVVHGAYVERSKIREASQEASLVAIRALREVYQLSADWHHLTSDQRSARLLLGFDKHSSAASPEAGPVA